MSEGPDDAVSLVAHRDYAMSAPTPAHFLPPLYVAGFAAATGEMPEVPVDGYAFGSLPMACHTVGCAGTEEGSRLPGPAPPGSVAPPEAHNIQRSPNTLFFTLP